MRKTSKGCNVDKWGIKQKAGIRPLSALRVNFVLKTHKKRQPLLFHWIPFFCEKSLIPPFATFWKPHPPPPPPPPPPLNKKGWGPHYGYVMVQLNQCLVNYMLNSSFTYKKIGTKVSKNTVLQIFLLL